MRWYHSLFGIGMAVSLFFFLLFTAMELVVFHDGYYARHYEKRDIMAETHMTHDALMTVTEEMLLYLKDQRDDLDMQISVGGVTQEVFGEREKAHMVDVKDLFVGATRIRNGAFVLILVGVLGGLIFRREGFKKSLTMVKYVFAGILLLGSGLGFLFYSNFSKYFILFHEIFFDNDLWLLDPRTDVLINMVPEDFFYETAMLCLLVFVLMLVATVTVVEVFRKR